MCSDTYLQYIPQVTSGIRLDYITKKGLWSIFACCLDGAIQSGVLNSDGDDNNNTSNWFIENVHWISPSDSGTNEDYYFISVAMVGWMIK